jgi:hypothetical protein
MADFVFCGVLPSGSALPLGAVENDFQSRAKIELTHANGPRNLLIVIEHKL